MFGIIRVSKADYFRNGFGSSDHSVLPHGIGGGLQDGPPYSDTARVPGGLRSLARLLMRLRSGGHLNY